MPEDHKWVILVLEQSMSHMQLPRNKLLPVSRHQNVWYDHHDGVLLNFSFIIDPANFIDIRYVLHGSYSQTTSRKSAKSTQATLMCHNFDASLQDKLISQSLQSLTAPVCSWLLSFKGYKLLISDTAHCQIWSTSKFVNVVILC